MTRILITTERAEMLKMLQHNAASWQNINAAVYRHIGAEAYTQVINEMADALGEATGTHLGIDPNRNVPCMESMHIATCMIIEEIVELIYPNDVNAQDLDIIGKASSLFSYMLLQFMTERLETRAQRNPANDETKH